MKKLTLTIKSSEQFAKQLFGKVKSAKDKEIFLAHMKQVRETALILAEKRKVDRKTLVIAANLHDIGRTISSEDHAFHSVNILKKSGFRVDSKLEDCILNHGSSKKPKTVEGKIIKTADKLCWIEPGVLRFFLKYNKKRIKKADVRFLEDKFKKIIKFLEHSDIR